MLNLIARFGGYLNRKHDPQPGPAALWIGLQKLRDFIQAKRVYDFIQAGKTYG
ncbi:MAG: IS4 family transposase [Candidatus Symbiodolus clandestinus]